LKDNTLLRVEKPVRYLGGEMGASREKKAELSIILAFPDVYEVGMSHLGSQILYSILNSVDWIAAERLYSPWPDMEGLLRSTGEVLTTLESGTPPVQADILGFTLQYELSYTNILNILELSGIPPLAGERDANYPLILGGGPCAYNPEPLADFFDAFLLGDGEEAVLEIAEACRTWKGSGLPKADLLERLSAIEGVYVPSFFDVGYDRSGRITAIHPRKEGYAKVRRRFVADLDPAPYPDAPIIPFLKTVHDRVSMEIARGCTRGCRFCQAGYVYRPVRERSPERLLALIEETLRNTGYDEISLLSLSTGDYGCIAPLLHTLMKKYADERIAVSFPSLRVGTLTRELADEVKKVRKTGFTLAPEAGSERLRQSINKGITEEDLLENAYAAYSAGWRVIKLYFMIGLPGEAMEDVLGIADLAKRVKNEGRRSGQGGEVNVSVGTFVPKPHTPFQWEPQIGFAETREKQQFLRLELKKRKLNFKWQDANLSFLEGVFARGDRRLGRVLLKARELGCRFDGWGELFDFSAWQAAFAATGIDPLFYHRRRELDETLPWDHLDCGVGKDYLLAEREKALACIPTPDCRNGSCTGCGVCDFKLVMMRLNGPDAGNAGQPAPAEGQQPQQPEETTARIRLRFRKAGRMRFLSHLEMINLFSRGVARASIPIRFSRGFHPHPKFSFATALSVGVESRAEYLDMEIAPGFGADRVMAQLNSVLPEGMEILDACEIPLRSASLSVIMERVRYRVTLADPAGLDLRACAERFLEQESWPIRREKKGKAQEIDLRHELYELKADAVSLEMLVGRGKPLEFAAAVTGLPPEELAEARIEKLEVVFRNQEIDFK
jgi:radical SAM family uncharacterized protein/radical SAM-linked protein